MDKITEKQFQSMKNNYYKILSTLLIISMITAILLLINCSFIIQSISGIIFVICIFSIIDITINQYSLKKHYNK